jgi:hypothetical protein
VLHLDDEIGLGDFDFLADFFDEVGGVDAVGNVDACGALGSRFIYEADENSHILLSISKLNIFFLPSGPHVYIKMQQTIS